MLKCVCGALTSDVTQHTTRYRLHLHPRCCDEGSSVSGAEGDVKTVSREDSSITSLHSSQSHSVHIPGPFTPFNRTDTVTILGHRGNLSNVGDAS